MAADDPSHDRVEAEPVGIVHVVVPAKAPENGLAELRDKTVATVLPTTGVGEYVPGNLAQSDRIIQFPVRQQPGVGSDLGTVELKLEPAVKVQPQNPLFRLGLIKRSLTERDYNNRQEFGDCPLAVCYIVRYGPSPLKEARWPK